MMGSALVGLNHSCCCGGIGSSGASMARTFIARMAGGLLNLQSSSDSSGTRKCLPDCPSMQLRCSTVIAAESSIAGLRVMSVSAEKVHSGLT